MGTYVIRMNSQKRGVKYKVAASLLFGGAFFTLRFSSSLLWPDSFERNRGLLSLAVETGLVALVFGVGMGFRPARLPNYKLLVDEDSITGVTEYGGWMKWLVSKSTVRKGEVRTIFDLKGRGGLPDGIGISKRSRWGARIWGFVYLPKTLTEYENLRRLAESWRSTDRSG